MSIDDFENKTDKRKLLYFLNLKKIKKTGKKIWHKIYVE